MTIDNRSTNQNYKLPNPQNLLVDDAQRLIEAIQAIDADVFDRYTKAEVDQAIADLIDGSPDTLNTLNEIAAAIADDSNYFTTINNALATKANLAGGNTFTGDQDFGATVTVDKLTIDNGDVYMANGALVFNDAGGAHSDRTGSNIDHIHHVDDGNDANTGYNFVSDGTFRQAGNADLIATNYLPGSDNTGNVGLSTRKFADGHFHDFQVDNVLNVRGAIDLADNDTIRLGSSDDIEIVHDGSNLLFKMDNDDDLIVMDHNSSDAQRFRVDVNEGRVYTDDNGYFGRSMASDAAFKSGVHSVTAYGRNSSTHDATKWSAYVQMNGDYRGHGNEATNEDTAMFYALQRNASDSGIAMHNLDVQGRAWHYGALYGGRGRSSTTGSAAAYYKTGEHIAQVYAGSSGSFTYIHGRNVADTSFVFQADVGTPRIEFRADGNGYFDGGADQGNADYAEMFEWADGNPDAEDRRGYPVCLDGEMVRFATSDDAPEDIIGIVSAEPAVLGDSATLNWQGLHLKDEYGAKLRNPVEYLIWNDEGEDLPSAEDEHDTPAYRVRVDELGTGSDLDKKIPDYAREANIRKTFYELVENPQYDPEQLYVSRRNRKNGMQSGCSGSWLCARGSQWVTVGAS